MNDTPLLDVRGISIAFGRGRRKALAVNNVSLQIARGETLGLVGESGSGKTTVGRAIMQLLPLNGGEILFDGCRLSAEGTDPLLCRKMQMIFQDPMSSLNERAKVEYIVTEGLYGRGLSASRRREAAAQALSDVGLAPDCMGRFPHEFSGGQRQRIGIARALIMDPQLIIADEPVSALDVSVRAQVLNLMNTLTRRRGLSSLFISHDLSVVRYIADRIAVIYAGSIVESAPAEELFARPLHPYTKSLISAIPVADPARAAAFAPRPYMPPLPAYRRLRRVGDRHFVLCSDGEFDAYHSNNIVNSKI